MGKTSILEALYLLASPSSTYAVPPYNIPPAKLVADLHGGSSSMVYGYSGEAQLSYELSRRVLYNERLIDRLEFIIDDRGGVEAYFGEREKIVAYGDFVLETFGCSLERNLVALYIPNHTSYYDMLRDFALREDVLRWVEKHGFHRRVVEDYISKCVYDRFTEVLVRKNKLCLRKEIDEGMGPLYVDIDSIGEGVRRFILVYLATEYLNPKILLWDDVEVAMHPGLLELVVKWLIESGRQAVISTHSLDFLYILSMEKPGNTRVVVLRKRGDDVVEYKSLTLDELEEMFSTGIDLRKIVDELQL